MDVAAEPGSDAPLGLRERSRQEAMQRLRDATTTLLAERSIDDITTREVAQLAGVGEATLFRHVGTKLDLLVLAYGDQMDRLLDEMEARDDATALVSTEPTGQDICDRVRSLYRTRAEFYLQNPDNAAAYLRQGFDMTSKGRWRTIAQGDRMIERASSILRFGQSRGVFAPSVDAHLVAQNCHGIFIHEVDRTRLRGFEPESIWQRVNDRLSVQLDPLVLPQAK